MILLSENKGKQALRVEGGLFGPGFLERLGRGEGVKGQTPKDFGLKGSLQEAIARAYEDARGYWRVFKGRLERLLPEESDTSLTREGWIIPFLGLLGYQLTHQGWVKAAGRSWPISHRADPSPDAPPVLVVGYGMELSRAHPNLQGRSPHGLLQDYLNASEHLWGLVTNGRTLRLLRQTPFLRRQAYLEVDLEALMEGEAQADFALLYRLLHRSRLPQNAASAGECLLEAYYQEALVQGERAREKLRDGVEAFLKELGTGFLRGPGGEDLAKDPEDFYHHLLRLAYRLLFLLVAEARGAIGGNELYREGYGLWRLARLVDDQEAYTEDTDLWQGLRVLFHLLRDSQEVDGAPLASLLGLKPLNGRLFEPLLLEEEPYAVENRYLLSAFRHLVYYWDEEAQVQRRINYAALDVEELGSVYESLLDNQPWVEPGPCFSFRPGTERKSTGSYYTPEALVDLLLKETLDPVIQARLEAASTREEKERALLGIKVLDPAAGSGHFLLGAARRLGRRLAQVRTGEEEPAPEAYRQAVRDVVAHCLYAVDRNPMAVELCRVALWIESQTPDSPLTFLDHRVRCGDSLVGIFSPKVLAEGIPNEAYKAKEGEDRSLAASLERENRRQRSGDQDLFQPPKAEDLEEQERHLAEGIQSLAGLPEKEAQQVEAKARAYEAFREGDGLKRPQLASHLWTAAFFQPLEGRGPWITTEAVWNALEGRVEQGVRELAEGLARQHRFFHWWLEFPEVLANGGFDVVLSNPPWERLKLEERAFFATRAPEVAQAANASERKKAIQALKGSNPALYREYREALRTVEALTGFLRASGRFPLSGRGELNTYALFTELVRVLVRPGGRVGLVVPTGLLTDEPQQALRRELFGEVVALYEFENRKRVFPGIHQQFRFTLLALEREKPQGQAPMAFGLTHPEEARDPRRQVALPPEELERLNPDTGALPLFRTPQDAHLTLHLHRQAPPRRREGGENPWGVRFLRMFDMANDSGLFRTSRELEARGLRLAGNRFTGQVTYLPLYEAKMLHQYDHRFAGYQGEEAAEAGTARQDPAWLPQPRYWVVREAVGARLRGWERGWLLGWRDITNATNERTLIAAPLPRVGAGDTVLLLFPRQPAPLSLCLLANLNSLVLDYAVRQKLSGTHLKYHILRQLPILPPETYREGDLRFIVPRVLELVYTAWDLAPLAQDVWQEADDALREAILAQHQANGGHPHGPPAWVDGEVPFPPFRWDEERRARLRAELDAYYARLYRLGRKALRYILDPKDLTEGELKDILSHAEEVEDPLDEGTYRKRAEESPFPGETFRVLKEKELRRYGEYRTRRLVLEAWEAFRR